MSNKSRGFNHRYKRIMDESETNIHILTTQPHGTQPPTRVWTVVIIDR